MKKAVSIIVLVCTGFGAGYLLRPSFDKEYLQQPVIRTDTLTVRDTVFERYPVPVTVTKVDTMLVPLYDTLRMRVQDTVYVVLDRQQKYYHGQDWQAWVSGYRPQLDSIRVFPETRYITTENISVTSRKRWGIGIQAGYGIGLQNGQVRSFPYIGLGISYDIIRW